MSMFAHESTRTLVSVIRVVEVESMKKILQIFDTFLIKSCFDLHQYNFIESYSKRKPHDLFHINNFWKMMMKCYEIKQLE